MANVDKAEYYDGILPSPIASDSVKKTNEYGLAVGNYIYKTIVEQESSYYAIRNALFNENKAFANGKQPLKTYLDLLEVDPGQMFYKMKYHPRPIAPKFRDILINKIMEKNEWIECTGLSLDMQKRKKDKVNDAAYRMDHKKFIDDIQNQTGIKFEEDKAFTPGGPEELELWSKMNDKEREELLMQEAAQFVLINNQWESLKREIVGDIVDFGIGWSKTYLDNKNRIKLKRINGKQMLHGPTNTHNFRKLPYMGHIEQMSIVDIRCAWPDYDEEILYNLAYNNVGRSGNATSLDEFSRAYYESPIRPYDGFLIDVVFFEYRVTKFKRYVKKNDKNENLIVEYKKTDEPDGDERKAPIPTIYCGALPIGSDQIFEWGEMSNLLRNNNDYEDVMFTYSGYMLNNTDNMLPLSPMAYCKSSIINMDLAILKLQQHLKDAAPDGVKIDIDAVTEVDFGKGIGKLGPMKLRQIRKQTGDIYYSRKKISGEQGGEPIQDAIHSMGDKIQQFITAYNFEFENLRNYIGYNPQTDGTGTPDRLSPSVQQNQLDITNTSTANIYDGFVSIFGDTGKRIIILLWQTLKFGTANTLYMKLLGQSNADFIRYKTDIIKSNYLTNITVDMPPKKRQFLENMINVSLQSGTIEVEDALMLEKTPDLDLAIRYLGFIKEQRATKKQEMANQAIQQQQQQQAQLNGALEDKKAKALQDKVILEQGVEMQKLINSAILLKMENPGVILDPYVQNLIDKQNAVLNPQQQQPQQGTQSAPPQQEMAPQQQQIPEQQMQ